MANNSLSRSFAVVFLLLNLALFAFGQGTQFITGTCTSDADCASGCCGFNSGKCAGPVVAQERDGGCGFGNPTPNANAAMALTGGAPVATSPATAAAPATTAAAGAASAANGASAAVNSNLAGSANVGNGAGKQFITGQCLSDADCASGCCGFNTGLCAGAVIAQTRDGGCGFGDTSPNSNAAQALTGGGASAPAATAAAGAGTVNSAAAEAPSATESASTAIDSSIPGAANVGNGAGKQFITGQCLSDADCASGCCGFNSGKCAGAIIAQTRDGGCGFGDATPNDTAAQALTGGAKKRTVREYMA
ncbi:hypothetical protein LTR99_003829 [Exophiala xenobiotica]|uniref:Biotrophy-associated secreted protein 2 n=1 Tax=Vermiconidia calcicola TaxID=1690605 RepID=A0AAV9Q0P5_9PEZI|nr:hypothetical protein H2202_007557 [Exophiala xenobiotica]KAK5531522.1 hypothetical protein LTR25_008631 [Vermiconidia calcicola]KAK5544691.1 hypothetical protein LTR23_004131 [Chaetothyriales sp. CCFEE 6169]KAK5191345.1 hypothetical protein LTR92_008516 [Exophiala xenobiotica]KAK5207028.1 hypothetical protein LTR41_007095 [Exophiala xenobiotica]